MKDQTKFAGFLGLIMTILGLLGGFAAAPPAGAFTDTGGFSTFGVTTIGTLIGGAMGLLTFLTRNTGFMQFLFKLIGVKDDQAAQWMQLVAFIQSLTGKVDKDTLDKLINGLLVKAVNAPPDTLAVVESQGVGALNLTGILNLIQTVATTLKQNPELVNLLKEVVPLLLDFFKKPATK